MKMANSAEVRASAEVADTATDEATHIPQPFALKTDGVYFKDTRICDQLTVVALSRDYNSAEWGVLVEFEDPDGNGKRLSIELRRLVGQRSEAIGDLMSLGLSIVPGQEKRVAEYLAAVQPPRRVRCVAQTGWYAGVFVLPDETLPARNDDEEVIFQGCVPGNGLFSLRGDLDGWQQNVARLCVGNSRLVLAASMAFAAPLLPVLGIEGGGVHLVGQSSIGKSTAMDVAASVLGANSVKTWRTTDNAIESDAGVTHNHMLLCLDEIGQVDGRKVGEIAYMLANGQGKGRASRDGGHRPRRRWSSLFLSNGEVTLEEKMSETGFRVRAGQEVRLVSLPADAGAGHGVFEELHGMPDGRTLADHLKQATATHAGAAFRAYILNLAPLLSEPDSAEERRREFTQFRDSFVKSVCPIGADGQTQRVAGRFAVIAFAAGLATALGILPWSAGEAMRGAQRCFEAWLIHRGGPGAGEVMRGFRQVRHFFERHGDARFGSLSDGYGGGKDDATPRSIHNRAGYRGEGYFLVFPEVMNQEILAGLNKEAVKKELAARGILETDSEGKFSKPVRLPDGSGTRRMYKITDAIFEGSDERGGKEPGSDSDDEIPF